MIHYSWAVVLAGGDGERLSAFTRDARGEAVPKQYCSFGTPTSMVRWAFARACRVVPSDRVLVVVNESHRQWWEPQLADVPPENLLIQPSNRGTATGVLFALLEVQARGGSDAPVLMLPSDHHVADEDVLRWGLTTALGIAGSRVRATVLLGMTPTGVDPEYGWILPATNDPVAGVSYFEEKPRLERVRQLAACGALINSFIIVARAQALVDLFGETLPELLATFRDHVGQWPATARLPGLYETLPRADFSRDVLERTSRPLTVVRAAPCGWSDVGTPARLKAFLGKTRAAVPLTSRIAQSPTSWRVTREADGVSGDGPARQKMTRVRRRAISAEHAQQPGVLAVSAE